jgi:hypothetical protein
MPDILILISEQGGRIKNPNKKTHLRNYLPAKIIILADLLPTH